MSEIPDVHSVLDRQFDKIRLALYYADPIKAILDRFDQTPEAERDAFVMALAFAYISVKTRQRLIDGREARSVDEAA